MNQQRRSRSERRDAARWAAASRAAFPERDGCAVTPLILAAEMFPALERLALDARHRLFLAFRVFDPATAARSDEARARGLADWSAILCDALLRGVDVRLLLTDFEPLAAHDLHAGSWATQRALRAAADALDSGAAARLQIIVAQHCGELGWAWRQLARIPAIVAARAALRAMADDPEPGLAVRPGLWPWIRADGAASPRARLGPAPRLWPATHHHKFAVADERVAIVGGLDVNERRWETPDYLQPSPNSWHDVSVRIAGAAAADAAAHFRALWNADLPRVRATMAQWTRGARLNPPAIEPLAALDALPAGVAPPGPAGASQIQMLRTLSRRSDRLFAIGPRKDVRELMHAHRRIIFSARRLLYIEAQFFRSWRAAGWIVEAARRNPALQVILLAPQAPDVIAFEGAGANPAHLHGEWLQARALGRLLARLGDRVGLYALGRRAAMDEEERKLVANRGAAFGAGMIYVHSKLLIADDAVALVSSANINNRSFSWDSEFGATWTDAPGVGAFRRRLWGQLLGVAPDELPQLEQAQAYWREVALANVKRRPEERQGFVLPYRYARVRRFGRPSWFVPDDLV